MQVPRDEYLKMVDTFIKTANGMKDEEKDINVVANALMEASAIYATFVSAGNQGYLQDSGVNKLVGAFRHMVNRIQEAKKAAAEQNAPGSGPAAGF